jgi:hypothetical protein
MEELDLSTPCPRCSERVEFLREYETAISGGAWPPVYEEIDEPCRTLVQALNLLPYIESRESCCGHGERSFWIMFHTNDLWALMNLLQILKDYIYGDHWQIRAEIAPPGRIEEQVWFRLVCLKEAGQASYDAAERLALEIDSKREAQ